MFFLTLRPLWHYVKLAALKPCASRSEVKYNGWYIDQMCSVADVRMSKDTASILILLSYSVVMCYHEAQSVRKWRIKLDVSLEFIPSYIIDYLISNKGVDTGCPIKHTIFLIGRDRDFVLVKLWIIIRKYF